MRPLAEHHISQPDDTTLNVVAHPADDYTPAGMSMQFIDEDGLPTVSLAVLVDDYDRLCRQLASIPQVRTAVLEREVSANAAVKAAMAEREAVAR